MKVLYFIEEPKLGGPQIQMVRVAAAINEEVTVELLIPEENGDRMRQLTAQSGLTYHSLKISHLTKELRSLVTFIWRSPFEIFTLVRFVLKTKPDLIHAWGGAWQFKAALVSHLTGVPLIWLLNDTNAPRNVRWIFSKIADDKTGYIFASARTKEYYLPLIPKGAETCTIQSMVDLTEFDPNRNYHHDQELMESWGDDFVIGVIANISPVKGLETFIRTAAHAQVAGRACRFAVIGTVFKRQERYFKTLQALAHELGAANVEFLGGREDVRPILHRIDAYLCSSNFESSPVSVWEALAMGCPVVSTDVGDVGRFVVDGKTGYVVPVGDDVGLWQALERLMDDPILTRRLGNAARTCAKDNFGRKVITSQTLAFYRRILKIRD